MNDCHTHNAYLKFSRVKFSRFIEDPQKPRKFYFSKISSYTVYYHMISTHTDIIYKYYINNS